jgi:hypothetical protein
LHYLNIRSLYQNCRTNQSKLCYSFFLLCIKEKIIDETRFDLFASYRTKDKDLGKLKAAVEFLKNKINEAIIGEPTSEVISNDKGIPKAIKFSSMVGKITGEVV